MQRISMVWLVMFVLAALSCYGPISSGSCESDNVLKHESRYAVKYREMWLSALGSVRKVGIGRVAAMIGWRPIWQGATNSQMRAGS